MSTAALSVLMSGARGRNVVSKRLRSCVQYPIPRFMSPFMALALPLLLLTLACSNRQCFVAAVTDPFANVSTPLRESMRGRHVGVTINVQLLDFQSDFFLSKYKSFEELTGATINPVTSTQESWFDDVMEDVTGAGFLDLYAIFGNWIPTFVEKGGLADISDDVREAVGLDWFDIMPAVRTGVATFQNKVYTVPLDGDVIVLLYRSDLVEGAGLPTPHTWDDVLEISEYYSDRDFTGDGVPDYANCLSTKRNDIAGTVFWSIASTFLQTKGTAQGAFFDAETFAPRSSEPEFINALRLYQKLVRSSPFRDNGETDWQDNLVEFEQGRCVLWYNYPGPTRILVSNQKQNNMTGVLNLMPVPGASCEGSGLSNCPFKTEDGANHAPFLASGGMSYAVNARSPEAKRKAALDFSFYISDPSVGFWDVAFPGSFLDPLRNSHTVSLDNPESPPSLAFLQYGWEERQLSMIKSVTEFNFFHSNYVLDLRILGANEYQESGTVPHLLQMWDGTRTAEKTAHAITESWNAVTAKYGLREQRAMYRETLGLAPLLEVPAGKSARLEVLVPVLGVTCIVILVLIAIVVKQHRHIKYKTRDVENAPREGTIALLFTDIEGSTSLWDASKSVMSKSLEIHHDVIRKCIDRHGAYEVKTIGDAFMVAVGSADAAVRLGNDIQSELLEANWPAELATLPSACVEYFPSFFRPPQRDLKPGHARPMFRGLRVRIGIHLGGYSGDEEEGGQIQIKYDAVAKGYDYYGPVVNATARIEALGFGGQTLISSDVLRRLSDDVVRECAISVVGNLDLRGVKEAVTLYQCLPRSLKGRRYPGVIRRRDSGGGSIVPEDDPSIRLTERCNADRTADVMSLTPVQLQTTVLRLRNQLFALEERQQTSMSDSLREITDLLEMDRRASSVAEENISMSGIGEVNGQVTNGREKPDYVENGQGLRE